jgi:hypothetical protein
MVNVAVTEIRSRGGCNRSNRAPGNVTHWTLPVCRKPGPGQTAVLLSIVGISDFERSSKSRTMPTRYGWSVPQATAERREAQIRSGWLRARTRRGLRRSGFRPPVADALINRSPLAVRAVHWTHPAANSAATLGCAGVDRVPAVASTEMHRPIRDTVCR